MFHTAPCSLSPGAHSPQRSRITGGGLGIALCFRLSVTFVAQPNACTQWAQRRCRRKTLEFACPTPRSPLAAVLALSLCRMCTLLSACVTHVCHDPSTPVSLLGDLSPSPLLPNLPGSSGFKLQPLP